jgi:hypothetical protein
VRARQTSPRAGSALVLALIVVGTVTTLSAGYLMLASAVTRRQSGEVESLRAFNLAEAGLAEAYLGLRVGKAGRIGSAAAPAAYGDGLLWVDATELTGDRIQLESTALCGGGRATLSLVVERVETPLGFFSDEGLGVEGVLLVDGFDSADGPYWQQTGDGSLTIDPSYPFLFDDQLAKLLFYDGLFYRYMQKSELTYWYDRVLDHTTLVDDPLYGIEYDIQAGDFTDQDWQDDFASEEYQGILKYFELLQGDPVECPSPGGFQPWPYAEGSGSLESPMGMAAFEPLLEVPSLPVEEWTHTQGGGLLGSNGDVTFQNSAGELVEIYGDVVPGLGGSVGGAALVTGSSESRDLAAVLPEVELPEVEFLAAVQQASALPMVVSPGVVGYERIDVAADAELIIRGPSTVVIGALVLEPGASLTLDTQDGDVNLFITSALVFEPGSVVTTSEVPQSLSVQVAAIPSVGGEAPVRLEGQSQFHGAIYAPATEVRIGSDFEVFGGIVARRLDLDSGARLHFDNAGFDALPKLVSWRIVEIPEGVRRLSGNPFAQLGLDPNAMASLSASHDLTGIGLDVTYVDQSGVQSSYSGPEADFDWGAVAKVVETRRSGGAYEGTLDRSPGAERAGVDPGTPISAEDQALISLLNADDSSAGNVRSELLNQSPLSKEVLGALFVSPNPLPSEYLTDVLVANSPLTAEVLTRVVLNQPAVLDIGDRLVVLGAQ